MKYKVGDKVRIKSIDWYNQMLAIKDKQAYRTTPNGCEFIGVWCGNRIFKNDMIKFCGQVMTIKAIENEYYIMHEDTSGYWYCDEMIEGPVEEETKPEFKVGDKITNGKVTLTILTLTPDKYIVDDNFGEMGILYFNTQDDWKLVEEEMKSEDELLDKYEEITDRAFKGGYEKCKSDILLNGYELPEGYIFKDQAGNVIHALKIVLEKANTLKTQSDNMETETHRGYYTTEEETTNKSKKVAWFTFWDNDFADKVELDLSNRELIQKDGKWFVVKKKKEYPKTLGECRAILGMMSEYGAFNYKANLITTFMSLLICRDAYWKIAGEEMGLKKNWEPDWGDNTTKYTLLCHNNDIEKDWELHINLILAFPTAEMRDAFYDNFKEEIEKCKELL